MAWAEALDKWAELSGSHEGFYLSNQIRNNKHTAILAVAVEATSLSSAGSSSGASKKKSESKKHQMYYIHRPNTGLQFRQESLAELEKKYKKVQTTEAENAWSAQYDASVTMCSHAYWRGNCRNVVDCEIGLRRRTYHVVSGSVLSVWARVESVLAGRNSANKMQVIRLRTDDGVKIVGTLIPKNCVESLICALSADAEKVEEKTY